MTNLTHRLTRNPIHTTVRLTLAAIWFYLAIVPKFIFPENVEMDIMRASGMFPGLEREMFLVLGAVEFTLGCLMLFAWNRRFPWLLNVLFLLFITAVSVYSLPSVFTEPFNPMTLGVPMIALSAIGCWSTDLDTADAPNRETATA
ncbi:MAG: DoxX-like family protein [Chloroflexota bacterium]